MTVRTADWPLDQRVFALMVAIMQSLETQG